MATSVGGQRERLQEERLTRAKGLPDGVVRPRLRRKLRERLAQPVQLSRAAAQPRRKDQHQFCRGALERHLLRTEAVDAVAQQLRSHTDFTALRCCSERRPSCLHGGSWASLICGNEHSAHHDVESEGKAVRTEEEDPELSRLVTLALLNLQL